jgi:hypothetical protein
MERGRVIDHLSRVTAVDVIFRVRSAGRARVLREKKKNVHAFVTGKQLKKHPPQGKPVQVRYNPYTAPCFFRAKDGKPLIGADFVSLEWDGTAWAYGEY